MTRAGSGPRPRRCFASTCARSPCGAIWRRPATTQTFGFAGFFAVAIRHQALGSRHETDQFPVILKGKNFVREIPRTYHGYFLGKSRRREALLEAFHTLLYDLKENVFTPYVMVETLGWFYSLPLLGKTLFAARYRRAVDALRRKLVPSVATTLTVDKLSRAQKWRRCSPPSSAPSHVAPCRNNSAIAI